MYCVKHNIFWVRRRVRIEPLLLYANTPQCSLEDFLECYRNEDFLAWSKTSCFLNINIRLHDLLQLNITFFSTDTVFATLKIYSLNKTDMFTFKGHYDVFNFYPSFQNVHISTFMDFEDRWQLNSSFSVIDESLIFNVETINHGNITPSLTYCVSNKFIEKFIIVVKRKLLQIIVKTPNSTTAEFVVFDGPGILAKPLGKMPVQTCSTFQCTVSLPTTYFEGDCIFTYHSKLIPISENNTINIHSNFSYYLPSKRCNIVCILQFNAHNDHQVNLTTMKLTMNSPYDPTCMYSGLVAGEIIQDDYKQSDTLCQSHNGAEQPNRSFYSQNSSLTLALYWYKSYSTINATVMMTQTKCESVVIDTCYFGHYCYGKSTSKICQLYLRNISKHSLTNVTTNMEVIRLNQADITCLVVTLSSWATPHKSSYCTVNMEYFGHNIIAMRNTTRLDHFVGYSTYVSKKFQSRVFKLKRKWSKYFKMLYARVLMCYGCPLWLEVISTKSLNKFLIYESDHSLQECEYYLLGFFFLQFSKTSFVG